MDKYKRKHDYCPHCSYATDNKYSGCCSGCGYLTTCLRNDMACIYVSLNTQSANVECGYYLDDEAEETE